MSEAPKRPLSLLAYAAAAGLASPAVALLLAARARRGKEDPSRLGERMGRASAERPPGGLVWMHGASVGESLSLLPLVDALGLERPDLRILMTSGTRASAVIMGQRLPPGALHQFAPVDTPAAVAGFLAHWRPALGVFAESELWPNLIHAARRSRTRLALVSARMTQRSANAWRARPAAARSMLQSFDVVLAQDATTSERLRGLGGRVDGLLNLKRFGEALPVDRPELCRLKAALGPRRVIAAVSTHEGEERLIAEAAAGLPDDVLVVAAPRRPERGPSVALELKAVFGEAGVARRSAGDPLSASTRAYVADTLNEMGLFLRVADIAVIGKSFGAETGGHNPLEPARLGVGVVSGPNVANFAEIYAEMASAGAARIVRREDLAHLLRDLFTQRERLEALGVAAGDFARRQEDQLSAALDLLRPLLPPA